MSKISLSVVSSDNWPVLRDCLQSIVAARGFSLGGVEVVLVDNASGSQPEWLAREYPWLKIVRQTEKCGFGQNHNAAFRSATGDFFVVLNDDTILEPSFFEEIWSFFERHEDAVAVGPWVELLDGSRQGTFGPFPTVPFEAFLWSIGQFGVVARWLLRRRTKAGVVPTEEARVPWICGVCMIWRSTRYAELGGFDEAFRIYYEDTELCHRAQQRWPGGIWFCPRIRIQHLEGSTMGSARTGDHRREVENIVSATIYFDRASSPDTARRFWRFAVMANTMLSRFASLLRFATLGQVDLVVRADRRLNYIAQNLRRRSAEVVRGGKLQPRA